LSLTTSTNSSTTDSSDDDLQKQFDDALEKAFEPCREHYAKLDEQRQQAKEKRLAIIASVKSIEPSLPEAELVNFD
jgi:Domain of Unknown Function (DUF349).